MTDEISPAIIPKKCKKHAPLPEMVQDVEVIYTNTTGLIKLRWKKSR